MALQKVEFEFPEAEEDGSTEIEIEDSSLQEMGAPVVPEVEEPESETELEIEVVDDTPEKDKGRKPSDPPEDITDDELEDYSEKVRKRIKHFSKGYHDERRAKEVAQREKEELERVAHQLVEENKRLNITVGQSQAAIFDQATKAVASELGSAKAAYKEAYEAGNGDAVLEAQERITTARLREEQLRNISAKTLQRPAPDVQQNVQTPAPQQAPAPDTRAVEWSKENSWFGKPGKDQMTALALGYHTELVSGGIDPTSDDYYEKLNARMRTVFPEEFEFEEDKPTRQKRQNVVAPATRSTAPKKIRLTQTQVAIAKRLGVPIELYAKQVAEDMRKDNG